MSEYISITKHKPLYSLCNHLIPIPTRVDDHGPNKHSFPLPSSIRDIQEEYARYRLGDPIPSLIHRHAHTPETKYSIEKLLCAAQKHPRISRSKQPDVNEEAYGLLIQQNIISLYADTDTAVFYGIQTLRQLIMKAQALGLSHLPCGLIYDFPLLPVRGLMLDISRGRVPTRATLEYYLDIMALIKLNHLQLYTEHTFAYKGHEKVWSGASPMTPEDIRWLDKQAQERGIELTPNQNSFGHMTPWLIHKEYQHLAETTEGFMAWEKWRDYPYSLSPAVPETIPFLDELYRQLLPHFHSRLFNVGCDETMDLGKGKSKELCKQQGEGRVYVDFLLKIHKLVRKHRKRMIFWADIIKNHKELLSELPKDIIAVSWWYEAFGKTNPLDEECRQLAKARVEFWAAPGTSSWNSITGRYDIVRANTFDAIRAVTTYGGSGMLMTDWGDGNLQSFPIALPGIVLAGCLAWSGETDHSKQADPFAFLNWAWFHDPTNNLGEALHKLGSIHAALGIQIHNNTLMGLALSTYDEPTLQDTLRNSPEDLSPAYTLIEEARHLLQQAKPASPDGTLLVKETQLAADAAEYALSLLPFHKQRIQQNMQNTQETASSNTSDINIDSAAAVRLQKQLTILTAEHSRQWDARFRLGGRESSIAALQKAARYLNILV